MNTERDRLFQAGRHLTPTQFGHVVSREVTRGVDFGGSPKGRIIEAVLENPSGYSRRDFTLDGLIGALRDQKNHLGVNAYGNPPPGLIKETGPEVDLQGENNALQTALSVAEDLHTRRKKELEAANARFELLRKNVLWVINDSTYKAPEQFGDVGAEWIERLRRAVEG